MKRIFTFLMLSVLLLSCSKEEQLPQKSSFLDVENWYNLNRDINKLTTFSTLSPNFNSTVEHEIDNEIIYEVELSNPENISIDGYMEGSYDKRMNSKLIFVADKTTGSIKFARYMFTLFESANSGTVMYKKVRNFSGKILYFNLRGGLESGWTYKKGELISKTSLAIGRGMQEKLRFEPNTRLSYMRPDLLCSTDLMPIYGWACVDAGGPEYTNCEQYIVRHIPVETCILDPDFIDPNPGGGSEEEEPYIPTEVLLDYNEKELAYRSRMTAAEKAIFDKLNFLDRYNYLKNAYVSEQLAQLYFPYSVNNGKGDAFRHAFFSALNVHYFGYQLTKALGDAHELVGNLDITSEMDFYNNEVGRQAGISHSSIFPNHNTGAQVIINLINAGSLKYINTAGQLVYTNQ